MILDIGEHRVIVEWQDDGTTVEARVDGAEYSKTWLSTVAFPGPQGVICAKHLAIEYEAISVFLSREVVGKVDRQEEICVVASRLRQACYDDETATLNKSSHAEQWLRMALAAIDYKAKKD